MRRCHVHLCMCVCVDFYEQVFFFSISMCRARTFVMISFITSKRNTCPRKSECTSCDEKVEKAKMTHNKQSIYILHIYTYIERAMYSYYLFVFYFLYTKKTLHNYARCGKG